MPYGPARMLAADARAIPSAASAHAHTHRSVLLHRLLAVHSQTRIIRNTRRYSLCTPSPNDRYKAHAHVCIRTAGVMRCGVYLVCVPCWRQSPTVLRLPAARQRAHPLSDHELLSPELAVYILILVAIVRVSSSSSSVCWIVKERLQARVGVESRSRSETRSRSWSSRSMSWRTSG